METYSVLALSTGHIEESDNVALKAAAYQTNMVMVRNSGYFIKLYQDEKASNIRPSYSYSLQKLIEFALDKGFGMIELDSAAEALEEFTLHDW
tara:strand:- start:500 stop:778 length:279 start_codon:yes stop_codon:yes gene_type:complete